MNRNFEVFTLSDVVKYQDYHKYPFKGISERIINEDITNCDILYWEPLEPIDAPFCYYEDSLGISDFSNLLQSRNIKIYAVYSEYNIQRVDIDNVKVIGWKTSLLHYCNSSVEFRYNDIVENIEIDNSNFTKLFNSLNLGVRPARVSLLDLLYKHNLFNSGDISWNHLTTDEPFKDMGLEFKYWNESRMKLDLESTDPSSDIQIHDTHLWTDYYLNSNCLFTVQVESIVFDSFEELHFLSEKTWKPLLLGQPFITIGSPGYYQYLQKFGFKIYDELIDYSFDKIEDTDSRINSVVLELKKLENQDYNELYDKIKDKVRYNRELCMSILKNDSYISNDLIEVYKRHQEKINNISVYDMNMNLEKIFDKLK